MGRLKLPAINPLNTVSENPIQIMCCLLLFVVHATKGLQPSGMQVVQIVGLEPARLVMFRFQNLARFTD
jgi:hypothetical protein